MASTMNPELAAAIIASAKRLGVDPLHIGTAISYETGGKFDPNLWGGKDKNYLGLIQFGPEERKKYGVKEGQTVQEQMLAAENFLRDRGVKPGMGLMDIYSTINAGSPGLYNRSDAANGGARFPRHGEVFRVFRRQFVQVIDHGAGAINSQRERQRGPPVCG